MITNPPVLIGRTFFTADFKSAGTPGGRLSFLMPGGRLSFLMPGGKSALYTYNKKDNKA